MLRDPKSVLCLILPRQPEPYMLHWTRAWGLCPHALGSSCPLSHVPAIRSCWYDPLPQYTGPAPSTCLTLRSAWSFAPSCLCTLARRSPCFLKTCPRSCNDCPYTDRATKKIWTKVFTQTVKPNFNASESPSLISWGKDYKCDFEKNIYLLTKVSHYDYAFPQRLNKVHFPYHHLKS